jgi:hypothetical protein
MKKRPGLCKQCGAPKERYPSGHFKSWYCDACTNARRDAYSASRNFCGQPHGYWPRCEICETERKRRQRAAALRGAANRRLNNPDWARPVHADIFWARTAQGMVKRAIRLGVLPRLDGSIACADCSAPAVEYDHRDYGRPLDVQPVCRGCNKKRGTAIWPHASQFNFVRSDEPKKAA